MASCFFREIDENMLIYSRDHPQVVRLGWVNLARCPADVTVRPSPGLDVVKVVLSGWLG